MHPLTKKIITLLIIGTMSCSIGYCQQIIMYEHDLRIGMGYPAPKDIFESKNNNITYTPNFYGSYGYSFDDKLKLSMTFSQYQSNEKTYYKTPSVYGQIKSTGTLIHNKLTPGVAYLWFNKGMFTMYSEVGITFDFTKSTMVVDGDITEDRTVIKARPNITPIGITFGRKYYISIEAFSLGPRGLFNAGIGCRF